MEIFEPYATTIIVLGVSGLLFFLQLLVADVVSIKTGHPPGVAVEQTHDSLLFRASRVFANSNESVGIFILFVLFAIFSAADAAWVNGFSLVYFIGRVAHMVFYYANLKLLRSVAFAVSCVGLLGIFVAGVRYYI